MLKENSLNIQNTIIKCTCNNEMTREFNNISDFVFNIQNNVRNFGIRCDQCDKFIPITSFLKKDEVLQIMNNFVGTICNL